MVPLFQEFEMRKIVAVLAVFGVCLSVAMADEFLGAIKKVDGNKLTVQKTKFNKDTKKLEPVGDEMTLTASPATKVVKGTRNADTKKIEGGDPIEGGLNAKALSSGKANAWIATDGDKVTEIRVVGGGKKNK